MTFVAVGAYIVLSRRGCRFTINNNSARVRRVARTVLQPPKVSRVLSFPHSPYLEKLRVTRHDNKCTI